MKILICNFKIVTLTNSIYRIGRSAENDIITDCKFVSRQACCLFKDDSLDWILIDGKLENSKSDNKKSGNRNRNGVWLNGRRVRGFAKVNCGDVVFLSKKFFFKFIGDPEKEQDEKSTIELLLDEDN